MNDSKTPRTDEFYVVRLRIGGEYARKDKCINFARQLETELAITTHQYEAQRKTKEQLSDRLTKALSRNTELEEELATLRAERDALRLAFSEASHNAGPAFVAHEDLASLRSEVERVTRERDESRQHMALARKEAECPDDDTLVMHCRSLRSQLTAALSALGVAEAALTDIKGYAMKNETTIYHAMLNECAAFAEKALATIAKVKEANK